MLYRSRGNVGHVWGGGNRAHYNGVTSTVFAAADGTTTPCVCPCVPEVRADCGPPLPTPVEYLGATGNDTAHPQLWGRVGGSICPGAPVVVGFVWSKITREPTLPYCAGSTSEIITATAQPQDFNHCVEQVPPSTYYVRAYVRGALGGAPEYSVVNNATFTVALEAAGVTCRPGTLVALVAAVAIDTTATFVGTFDVPSGYTVTGVGFLWASDPADLTLALCAGTVSVTPIASPFTIDVPGFAVGTHYARAYVTTVNPAAASVTELSPAYRSVTVEAP